jgi:hypothetical protein
MSPMHAPQGFMNHFFKANQGIIQELEKNSEWQSQIKLVKNEVSEELTGDVIHALPETTTFLPPANRKVDCESE